MTMQNLLANVSRETLDQLETYAGLIRKWNPVVNLVAKSTLDALWDRHILDSAQLLPLIQPDLRHWVDLGSGGGLPGIVVAILAREIAPQARVTLVEVDQRKSAFLREVSRQLNLPVKVATEKIETLAPQGADVISARALAALDVLCGFAHRHLAPDGQAIFPKGATFEQELSDARKRWHFDLKEVTSLTQAEARILILSEIRHV
ncbi:16S rRNA (guanine(527)-N(7))-methyltransferase RsmG [Gemmobacter serpentinus]|uniref:16S rRNA (guanine(527)-N(7))-methyltransferase RsmG n=1 Tax=Gemmobacter serpentinus TaxID=2652247 RepID=UPI00124D921D|nr:16S rRNA (guanine(527)-N(7))-methyltransferase RsmG [Gemmobacter serpentinus]